MSGVFVAVVGPSGAGKDTLIDVARAAFAGDANIIFAERSITRPADAGGERHRALSEAAFEATRSAGAFALSWSAHGLHYGIPVDTVADVAAGRCVVANLSRAAVTDAVGVYARVHVIHVTAPEVVLAERLAARGREAGDALARRRARAGADLPADVAVSEVVNDRPVEVTGPEFVAVIKGICGARA